MGTKVVFDTNILISSTIWDESVAQKVLQKLIMESSEILSSVEIIDEYKNILKRDFHFDEIDIAKIMQRVLQFVSIVSISINLDIIKDDSDDNKIIECAVEGNAEYIITYDKHLLNIKEYSGIKIIKPEEYLYKVSF